LRPDAPIEAHSLISDVFRTLSATSRRATTSGDAALLRTSSRFWPSFFHCL